MCASPRRDHFLRAVVVEETDVRLSRVYSRKWRADRASGACIKHAAVLSSAVEALTNTAYSGMQFMFARHNIHALYTVCSCRAVGLNHRFGMGLGHLQQPECASTSVPAQIAGVGLAPPPPPESSQLPSSRSPPPLQLSPQRLAPSHKNTSDDSRIPANPLARLALPPPSSLVSS